MSRIQLMLMPIHFPRRRRRRPPRRPFVRPRPPTNKKRRLFPNQNGFL